MKENIYDNEIFFEKYSQMERSKKGLEGAGEWHELKKLLPNFKNRSVLDLGCGYGWQCKYAADNGASRVLGTDISHKMIKMAKSKNNSPVIEYICTAMEDLNLNGEEFDVVISSLAFHYVRDFDLIVKNIFNQLKSDGRFVFSVEHPVFTAYGTQDWIYGENNEILYFPVDNYYYEGKREAVFLGERVIKYHRTLTTYIDTLIKAGFVIQRIVEPMPPENMMDIPGMKDEMRRPMMLIISAEKP